MADYGQNEYTSISQQTEDPSLFGTVSSLAAQMYGYIKIQDFGRAAALQQNLSKSSFSSADNVFFHLNIPFTGGFDKGGFGSISKAYNGLKASDDLITSAFKYNNFHFFEQLEGVGFSKEDVKTLKKFSGKRNRTSFFKNYLGAGEYVPDSEKLVENIIATKKIKKPSTTGVRGRLNKINPFHTPVDMEEIKAILNKTDDAGELLIKKVSPNVNQLSTKGIGFAFNFTKFAESMPKLSKYVFTGAKVAASFADFLWLYDIAKTAGDVAINTYHNTDGYKNMSEKQAMVRAGIKSYDELASYNDNVLSSRITSENIINEEKMLIQSALSAKTNVNEVLRQSIGGYSANELAVNKVRKSGR